MALRGGARLHPRLARRSFVGLLALAGVPPLAGFVSKEHILAAAEDGAHEAAVPGAWVVLVALSRDRRR